MIEQVRKCQGHIYKEILLRETKIKFCDDFVITNQEQILKTLKKIKMQAYKCLQ